jgi:hypothetical protein
MRVHLDPLDDVAIAALLALCRLLGVGVDPDEVLGRLDDRPS